MDRLQLRALAKINLGLDVLRRREDGYHEVKMIMQTVRIFDQITLEKKHEEGKQVQKQHEIDFVINRGNDKIYIQSAWRLPSEEKRRQELLPLRHCGDFFKKIVITEACVRSGAAPTVIEK